VKSIVLIISIFLGCSQPNEKCLNVVVINDILKTVEIDQEMKDNDTNYIGSTCDCYHDWDSVLLLNPLLVDSTKLLSAIKIYKDLTIKKKIYAVYKSPNRFKRQTPTTVNISPNNREHLKMEICAIDGKNHLLYDKYSEQDVVNYLRIVKYQANDSITYEGIDLPSYFTEIINFY